MAPLRCRVSSTPSALQGRLLRAPLPHSDPPRPLSSRYGPCRRCRLSPPRAAGPGESGPAPPGRYYRD
eukprot:621102-Hanusia_phi.AAC.1